MLVCVRRNAYICNDMLSDLAYPEFVEISRGTRVGRMHRRYIYINL